jgi:hypothetical protein
MGLTRIGVVEDENVAVEAEDQNHMLLEAGTGAGDRDRVAGAGFGASRSAALDEATAISSRASSWIASMT